MISNYMLPGLYNHRKLYQMFFHYYQNNKEAFRDNINFYCVYGSFPWSIWDGGRIFYSNAHASKEEIVDELEFYKSIGVIPRIICTNPVLKEPHLYDNFMNVVCELVEQYNGEIVINSQILEDYVKEHFPNLTIISSTTKRIVQQDECLKELEKDIYKFICLDYDLNKNFKFLDNLTPEIKSKCEFLVNAICPPGCPTRKHHYDLNGYFQLNHGKQYALDCGIKKSNLHPDTLSYKHIISPADIENIYVPKGFVNFKLEGRTFEAPALLGNLVRYFVKEEYQLLVYSELIEDFMKGG